MHIYKLNDIRKFALRLQAVEYVWEVVLGWSHDSVVDSVPDKQCFSCVTRGRG